MSFVYTTGRMGLQHIWEWERLNITQEELGSVARGDEHLSYVG